VGLRDREFDRKKPAGTFRIGIIGDSVTYGLACERGEAFAKQLEGLLRAGAAAGTRYEVLNLGVSGYNIGQIVEQLRTFGMSFGLDLVIYAYSLNDPQSFSLELQGLTAMREEARRDYRPTDTLRRWLAHSRIFLLAWQAFQQPWTRPVHPPGKPPDYVAVVRGDPIAYFESLHQGESWKLVQRGLSDLAAQTGGAGTDPRILVAVFPVSLGSFEPYPLAGLHQRIVEEAEQSGGGPLFNDPFHPTPAGHLVAARALLDWMGDAGILDEYTFEASHR
jgi:lysophospholipase L1-like esterase